ncbi:hypothetical protein [Halorussus caseinilyticus]|uniref:Uncharacterized protein n=1 Tax=Halorussus caseinilyticus TaxID=3034025 RepID=A0ABD5WHJ1_9EURY
MPVVLVVGPTGLALAVAGDHEHGPGRLVGGRTLAVAFGEHAERGRDSLAVGDVHPAVVVGRVDL